MNSKLSKNSLRDEFKQRLAGIDFFSLIEKSARLSDYFFSWTQANAMHFRNRAIVSFYPFGNEPQLNIESEARNEPYQVAYMRIYNWGQGLMEAHFARRDLPGMWNEVLLSDGGKIFQPTLTQPLCKPEEVAVVLVPGLAFTQNGLRLGRGAGFYDRFLNRHPHALRLGIGFEDQIADQLPCDSWDMPLDLLITDAGIKTMKSYGEWQKHGSLRLQD